ncbi:MAG: phosphoglycerate dehydrogenase [Deltaproteobacteria bacterium]|uniref:hydroxyacid dehydrogenase n=1 Tax=Desulfobacula sp. TaxID=2593537 RepID=UPI0019AA9B42|nr:phosphoglycerate dehydrogenase [Candidatus Desulfobacula maris]MBL6995399.1 phosphoglycerate dehydrogenase [Desulfobacula sp.]
MKILVSDPLSNVGIEIFKNTPGIEVDVKTDLTPSELEDIIGDYHALSIRSKTKVTKELLSKAKNLKVVGRAGIGLDNVDIPAATKAGVAVMNTPFGNAITTAEHTIAMIMALSRNIPRATATMKDGKWEKKNLKGREIYQKTLGLVGIGNIGSLVAERALGLKMKVIGFDPYQPPESIKKMGIRPVSFDEILAESDYISIHTPKTAETTNLFNKETLFKMKKGAMLINCARGGIVNEDDLHDALKANHLGGGALDVFVTEPPGKICLMDLDNFICTSHLGASTYEAQDNVARDVANQIVEYLKTGKAPNIVNQ